MKPADYAERVALLVLEAHAAGKSITWIAPKVAPFFEAALQQGAIDAVKGVGFHQREIVARILRKLEEAVPDLPDLPECLPPAPPTHTVGPVIARRKCPPPTDLFTNRLQEVLVLMDQGLTSSEIATELGITDNTVRSHVKTILLKLGAKGRVQALNEARKLGLLSRVGAPPTPPPPRQHQPELTERELAILTATARGLTSPQIAPKLHVSRSRIDQHFKDIFLKLTVKTRIQAVQEAQRLGLIPAPAPHRGESP